MLLVDITANNNDLNWLLRIRDINPIPRLTSYKFVCLFVLVCMSAFCFLISSILLSVLLCLSVCMSACLYVCLYVYTFVCLLPHTCYIYMCVCIYLYIHSWRPSFYPKFYVSLFAGKLLSLPVNCVRTLVGPVCLSACLFCYLMVYICLNVHCSLCLFAEVLFCSL